jgi:hypothetical protein
MRHAVAAATIVRLQSSPVGYFLALWRLRLLISGLILRGGIQRTTEVNPGRSLSGVFAHTD